MPLRLRRGITVMATAALVLLTGCTVSGTVEVRSSEEVVVDLIFRNDSLTDYRCDPELFRDFSLTIESRTDDKGEAFCELKGVVHPERLRQYLNVTHAGEFVAVSINPLGVAPGGEQSAEIGRSSIGGLDVAVRFPGQVLNTTGEPDGNIVRFREPKQLGRPYGLAAEALNHPGPPWAAVGPLAGFLVGVAATLWWAKARRRRRSQAAPPPDPASDEIGESPDSDQLAAGEPATPQAGAGDSSPGVSGPADSTAEPGDDGAGRRAVRPARDDSVWAPPADS